MTNRGRTLLEVATNYHKTSLIEPAEALQMSSCPSVGLTQDVLSAYEGKLRYPNKYSSCHVLMKFPFDDAARVTQSLLRQGLVSVSWK